MSRWFLLIGHMDDITAAKAVRGAENDSFLMCKFGIYGVFNDDGIIGLPSYKGIITIFKGKAGHVIIELFIGLANVDFHFLMDRIIAVRDAEEGGGLVP
ncbi:hypothetical protein [Mariprofundus sp. EBB-1]|uniref:hypothetical protein n=1 Tax=Mariprofundus sp. EBB-1 TaxID=2650971 RepID=UPI0011C398FF|nr:hypothetical protein [Mariprofundus sp. EBB-1]